ncbi:hypothetical protein [Pseudobdellovibrio exovorus]|uniref:Uncharacterized protein n=1 Tax=Pseudobdellovibrio exovorus JSS TaxID=1184267 RepID=M4V5B4_9BACT|nr:hypothetical protein [Pseudobdellovibrio exovorus]AGH94378.1 hypothetical protein A11Q_158 [Pseudobdellovibrio exovorus JSS]
MKTLAEHLTVKEEERNQNWDEVFFKLFSEANIKIMTEDPQQGPDGWPYLITETSDQEISSENKVDSAQKVLRWLSDKGIGLVLNPRRNPYPDYVFSYGMIWSFRETGLFIKYNDLVAEKEFVLDQNSFIKTGPPSAEYLPDYVRLVLKDFFRDQGIFDARVLMISTDGEHYDLCFSLESLGTPPDSEHEGILEAISWFLPPHYSIAVVSEQGLAGFASL